MEFNFDQAYKYFSYRLPTENISARDKLVIHCPFHADVNPSFSLNLKSGLWKCHTCNEGGGILAFEQKMMGKNTAESWEEIARITGISLENNKSSVYAPRGELVATYDYYDPDRKLLYQKLRYERIVDGKKVKDFIQRAPLDKNKWKYSLEGIKKVIYKLPEVIMSNMVIVVEGEKCADRVNSLNLLHGNDKFKVIATTSFDGAGKWKSEYSPYFTGKYVVIFPDNNDIGKRHALDISNSVYPFAHVVKIVDLPNLPEKGDIYDYLEDHSVEELLKEIKSAHRWNPDSGQEKEKEKPSFFVTIENLLPGGESGFDWIIPGIIHRESRGIFVAAPKAGKSVIALDLGVALASCQPWLGIQPPKVVRTAIISREDGAQLTRERTYAFLKGRGIDSAIINRDLFFNTHKQRQNFSLDTDEDVEDAAKALKEDGIEFCIVDVLNKIHSADENSNTEMTKVMAKFDYIRDISGSQIAIIHHDTKSSMPGSKKPRGASAIDSWWDWKVSISPDPKDDSLKEVFFSTKATKPHQSMMVSFFQLPNGGMKIVPEG